MSELKRPDLQNLQQYVVVHEMPTDILVELTAHCNLACIMCPHKDLTRPKGNMSFDLWKKIIDELAAKKPDIRIWPALMGESFLLGEKLFDYIRYAKDRGMQRLTLNTNLNVFQPEWLDALFDCGLDEMIVSMDGASKQVYEQIRRNASYETLLANLGAILYEKRRRGVDHPRIVLQFVVMEENEHEQQAFFEFWRDRGADVELKIKPRTGWSYAVENWQQVEDVARNEKRIPCTWLLRQMTVLWDGRVPQCDGDWDLKYACCGDANTQSLEDIWNGRLKELREKHLHGEWDFEPCRSCRDWAAGTADFYELKEGGACSNHKNCGATV